MLMCRDYFASRTGFVHWVCLMLAGRLQFGPGRVHLTKLTGSFKTLVPRGGGGGNCVKMHQLYVTSQD